MSSKSNPSYQRKSVYRIILLFVVMILMSGTVFAEAPSLTDESMIKIAQEVRQCRNLQEEVALRREATEELQKQLDLQRQFIDNKDRIIDFMNEKEKIYQQHVEFLQNIVKVQDEIAKKAIKDVKPGIMEKVETMSVGAIIGVILVQALFWL